jgi:hypothetical protein
MSVALPGVKAMMARIGFTGHFARRRAVARASGAMSARATDV